VSFIHGLLLEFWNTEPKHFAAVSIFTQPGQLPGADMSYIIEVENIKCGGCANSIRKGLLEDARVNEVDVDIEGGKVSIDGDESARDEIAMSLAHMGYPEVGSVEGMKAAAAKAKSFVSCAIGRIEVAKNS